MLTKTELAFTFSQKLHENLAWSDVIEINRLNACDINDSICHSHDFCDPNQCMIDALEHHGIPLDTQDKSQSDLINAAWGIAKEHGFNCHTIVHGKKPIKPGTVVKIKPKYHDKGDDKYIWTVVEDNGDRLFVTANVPMAIKPVHLVYRYMIEEQV